jgi:hypothetical protein
VELKEKTRLLLQSTDYYSKYSCKWIYLNIGKRRTTKKIHDHTRLYQRIILALIRMKPERRKVNFIFNPKTIKPVVVNY